MVAPEFHMVSPEFYEEEKTVEQNRQWLDEHWAKANQEKANGELISVSKWFFDDVTEPQLKRLEKIGIEITKGRPTKGQASDLIGLFEPPEPGEEDVLRFFKVSLRRMNQSTARYEIEKLLADPENRNAWVNRPATRMELEFYRFVGEKPPKAVTHTEAAAFQSSYIATLPNNSSLPHEWDSYESIWDELSDREFRKSYGIKKVHLSLYRKAIEELQEEGKTMDTLADDIDIVVEKIVELKPDLLRA